MDCPVVGDDIVVAVGRFLERSRDSDFGGVGTRNATQHVLKCAVITVLNDQSDGKIILRVMINVIFSKSISSFYKAEKK